MRHLDLFAGIGGFSLAAQWMGWETVAQVEWDKWCQKVLAKNFPDALRFGDIVEFNKMLASYQETRDEILDKISHQKVSDPDVEEFLNDIYNNEIEKIKNGKIIGYTESAGKTEVRKVFRERQGYQQSADTIGVDTITERGTGCISLGRIDIITGGFPCQPFSYAGKRKGTDDSRYLWPAMLETIRRVKPTYVVGENVAGLVSMENGKTLDRILSDLEDEGYSTEQVIIPACAVGAWHRRDRIWIVARNVCHSESAGLQGGDRLEGTERPNKGCEDVPRPRLLGSERDEQQAAGVVECGEDAADINNKRFQAGKECNQPGRQEWTSGGCCEGTRQWQSEPSVGRVANGIPRWMDGYWDREPEGVPRVATGVKDRVNRLKGLGNAIVPQVVYQIFKAIEQYEINR